MDDASGADARGGTPPFLLVTNRQPYGHRYAEGGIECSQSQGGVATALDSVMRTVGGEWIAWGSESADFDPSVVDPDGTLELPPEDPSYTLERIELDRSQVATFYRGYSNQVLWPLFHSHVDRIDIQPSFWAGYRDVNERFADAIADAGASRVWLHDYHFLLVPKLLAERTSEPPRSVFFVHIPWPSAEIFAICPHADRLLEGVLASDHVGFHTATYRDNFLECVERHLPEATVDRTSGRVVRPAGETETFVQPVGIYPDAVAERASGDAATAYWDALSKRHRLDSETRVVVGVDRLDYTKGILKRLEALEHLWERRPEHRESFVYVQKATKTRGRIEQYRDYRRAVRDRVHRINDRFGTDEWTPIVYVDEPISFDAVLGLYRGADVCVVSSTSDGMNLVSLEFVAASRDAGGALVLSQFTGAAAELEGAIEVNPFDIAALADAIADALAMSESEAADRMATLRSSVADLSADAWVDENLARLSGDDGSS